MSDAIRFHADLQPLRRYCVAFGRGFLLLALAVVAVNWVRAGHLRLDRDLVLILAMGPVGGAFMYLLIGALARAYPIDITPHGLITRNTLGRPRLTTWAEITSIHPFSLYGIPYLVLRCAGRTFAPTLPLWLQDLPRLRRTVERFAGETHVLSVALREAI